MLMKSDIRNINYNNNTINVIVELPLSKSIINRQLMIYAYARWSLESLNINGADDTLLLKSLLLKITKNEIDDSSKESIEIFCKNAGTVARFLLPYLALCKKKYSLSGSERMLKRPIFPLLSSLRNIGANIESSSIELSFPLKINPSNFSDNFIEVDVTNSSQFASALLLMLPSINNENKIRLNGNLSSMPYILLTLELMKQYGVEYKLEGKDIYLIGRYTKPKQNILIERDWSSASYFYQILALKGEGEILLKSLKLDSIQGDSKLADIFETLGVESVQKDDGVLIIANKEKIIFNQNIDFNDIPDLAPAVICTCAAMGVIGKFTGLHSLNFKESRRMDVICKELDKLGFDLRDNGMDEYIIVNSCKTEYKTYNFSGITINSHDDHRIVMAFAPIAIIGKSINISHQNSVVKSFPNFWEEFDKVLM